MFRAMLAQSIDQEPDMEACGEAGNIHDAMVLIERSLPDLAVVDINLQGSCGLELVINLKARRIQLPVLVLSMHAEALYAERVLRASSSSGVGVSSSTSCSRAQTTARSASKVVSPAATAAWTSIHTLTTCTR